jgi:hypothetical protein
LSWSEISFCVIQIPQQFPIYFHRCLRLLRFGIYLAYIVIKKEKFSAMTWR